MYELEACYRELAEYLVQKHNPKKLDILKFASVDRGFYLIFPLPYPLTERQKNKCYKLGSDPESMGGGIFKWILAFVFPEFGADINFFMTFYSHHAFWQLNLEYYKKKQKTIFEDYPFLKFDWDTRNFWLLQYIEEMRNGAVSEETRAEDERQSQLLRAYGDKIMQIATNAVAYL